MMMGIEEINFGVILSKNSKKKNFLKQKKNGKKENCLQCEKMSAPKVSY